MSIFEVGGYWATGYNTEYLGQQHRGPDGKTVTTWIPHKVKSKIWVPMPKVVKS